MPSADLGLVHKALGALGWRSVCPDVSDRLPHGVAGELDALESKPNDHEEYDHDLDCGNDLAEAGKKVVFELGFDAG